MRRGFAFALAVAGMLALICALLLTVVEGNGANAELYGYLQALCGVDEAIGVSREDLTRLDEALADYLRGDEAALDVRVAVYGEMKDAFNRRELAHMADVLGLFRLMRAARRWALVAGLTLLFAGGLLRGPGAPRDWPWAYGAAALALLLPLGAFALWAALDFDGAFVALHRTLFANELWLLDPDTDLLIRMLPEGFFARMGIRIAWMSLAALIGGGLLTLFAARRARRA